jgi:hypothetical protein
MTQHIQWPRYVFVSNIIIGICKSNLLNNILLVTVWFTLRLDPNQQVYLRRLDSNLLVLVSDVTA